MSNNKLLAQYGLKFNPFLQTIPAEYLWTPPRFDHFLYRVESIIIDGGFIMISGEPGLGKSKLLQLLAGKLKDVGGIEIGVMERPQSNLGDFYCELGDLFDTNFSLMSRYAGFKNLRAKWRSHIAQTLFKPVLLIDEAQEIPSQCLNEIRLLGSVNFDSDSLITTILCGDNRLPERFREPALIPVGTRIKCRHNIEPYSKDDLLSFLNHVITAAGAAHLMTNELKITLIEHCLSNPRILMNYAAELLDRAMHKNLALLDEKLFFDTFSDLPKPKPRKK